MSSSTKSGNRVLPAEGALEGGDAEPGTPKGKESQRALLELTPRKQGSGQRTKEQELAELRKAVGEKVAGYVPDEAQDESAEFTGTEMITVKEILFRFADKGDLCYFYVGAFASFGFGAALPGFCFIFGELIDKLGASTQGGGFAPLQDMSLYMLYVAIGVWVVSWF